MSGSRQAQAYLNGKGMCEMFCSTEKETEKLSGMEKVSINCKAKGKSRVSSIGNHHLNSKPKTLDL